MRRCCIYNITILLVLGFAISAAAVADFTGKLKATATPVPLSKARSIIPSGAPVPLRLATGDTCTAMDGEPIYYIYPWVYGDEVYKSYQDPTIDCSKPYPYTVQEVGIYLCYFGKDTIYLSADVEDLDITDPQ